jgi:hypothetical protein
VSLSILIANLAATTASSQFKCSLVSVMACSCLVVSLLVSLAMPLLFATSEVAFAAPMVIFCYTIPWLVYASSPTLLLVTLTPLLQKMALVSTRGTMLQQHHHQDSVPQQPHFFGDKDCFSVVVVVVVALPPVRRSPVPVPLGWMDDFPVAGK